MNRLILIGNGFDLAHGFRTSYKDFILCYLGDCLRQAGFNWAYEDDLIRIESSDLFSIQGELSKFDSYLYNSDLCLARYRKYIANHYESKSLSEFLNITSDEDHKEEKSGSFEEGFRKPFDVEITSSLLKSLILDCLNCNWVDIENRYFDELLKLRGEFVQGTFDSVEVERLNREFGCLKTKLEKYLLEEEERQTVDPNKKLLEIFNSKFDISDFDTLVDYELLRQKLGLDHTIKNEVQHKAHLLNFNYTNTLLPYSNEMRRKYFAGVELNHIHGQLNSPSNPIIFGFGDEHDKKYQQFEEQRINALFDHIKSYQYFRTGNYRNLVRFLNEDMYQVFVMGHSCGLSDRTMFKEIFDHDNCKSIKIFHYKRQDGSTDFHEKVVNIGRHFSDKGRMRKLIVEYKESDSFPQADQILL